MDEKKDTKGSAEREEDQYDALAARFKELFEGGAERSADFAREALEKARVQLTAAGEFSDAQGKRLKAFMERDLGFTADAWRNLGDEARRRLSPSRLGAGALASLTSLLESAGSTLSALAHRTGKALDYRSGEITSAGTLTCVACGHEMHFKKTGRIPPCPKCHATEFRKSY